MRRSLWDRSGVPQGCKLTAHRPARPRRSHRSGQVTVRCVLGKEVAHSGLAQAAAAASGSLLPSPASRLVRSIAGSRRLLELTARC